MNIVDLADNQFEVLDHVPVGMWIINRDYKVLFWNRCIEDWTGTGRNDILGGDFTSHFPHFKQRKYSDRIASVFDSGAPIIFSSQLHGNIFGLFLPNGEPRIQHTTVIAVPFPDGDDFRAVFAVEDVTDLTNRIAELHRTERELRQAHSEMGIRVQERTAELASANDLLIQEIAEREQTEQALQYERDRIQKYLDVAGVMLIVIDKEQKLKLINKRGHDVLKYAEMDTISKDWCSNFIPEHARDDVNSVISGLLNGQVEKYEYYENPVLTRNGAERIIAWHNTVLYNEIGNVEAILSSGEDITDRKRAEETAKRAYNELQNANRELKDMQSQLVQSEKLASIGQLAAGVAHEINTPVGFVASNFQTLESYVKKFKELLEMYEELAEEIETLEKTELLNRVTAISKSRKDMKIDFILEDIKELFDDSKEGLDRVTNIIRNLKDFSRVGHAEDFAEYDLNTGIETTLVVARNEIKYDADVKMDFSEIPPICCNSGQINQVFLNILLNATQAIKSQEREGMGNITIQTYATEDEVVCEISDDGPGIAPDKLPKIFDPFFTTKPAGKGTGLGLSVSYDIIVNKHKGKLLVESTVGKGTKFTIKLPIGRKESSDRQELANNGNILTIKASQQNSPSEDKD